MGEIWVMERLQGQVKGRESLFPNAICYVHFPSTLCLADDMPKHQEKVYEEFLSFVSISLFIILRAQNRH